MKKHLLLILALLAFVLPARAQSEPDMLYNFKNNSTASTYGTTFGTSVDIDNVIANVTGVDVTDYGANAKNYVSAITEATNVAYNSKGGVYMKAGGKLTFTLKKGYKVTGYQFMGQQVDGTTATITLNGINFDGPTETQASGQYSRLYPVPSEVKTVNSITISSNADVYIKSVGIYIEAEDTPTPEKCATPVFSPASGTFGAGKEITVTCSTPGATITVVGGLDNNESFTLTSGQTFKLPNKENTYNYAASATATGYTESETADASYIVDWPACAEPVFSPAGGTVAPGTVVTLTCATAGAEITYYPADNEDDFNLVESGHTFPLPTTPGTYTYKAFADASATFYGQSEIVTATYTVTAPVREEVAPVISFSHEDQKVFGSEEEIDVTLSLNHDVYPVPEVIYYTLDGFMAHNTLETGNPGATPAGHVLEAAVNPSTLSGTVRIERSHRDALNHRAVTINAYTFNTAGSDVAAATYIFNDNAAPAPQPEPTTITATVTMANQGWGDKTSPYTNASTVVNWNSTLADGQNGPIFSTTGSAGGPKYYNSNSTLRVYSGNVIYVTAPEGYVFVSAKANFSNGALQMKPESVKEYSAATSDTEMVFTRHENAMRLRVESGSNAQIETIEYVLAKADAATAAPAVKANAANNTDDFDTFNNGKSSTSYSTYNSTDGWKTTQCQLFNNRTSGVKIKRNDNNLTPCTKKSTTTAKITSPKLTGGIGTLKFTYGLPYSDTQINFKVQIQDTEGKVLKEESVTETGKTGGYTQTISKEFNIAGDFVIVFATPTSVSSRQAFYDVSWTNYGGTPTPTVEAPVISLSEHANTTEPVTVTIDCATEGATVTYTVKKDGTTVADNLTYDHANKPVFSEVGSYTVNATASKEGMNPANATPANFTIEKLVEVVEELFFVMDQNLWDVDGAYPETVVPFEYKGNNTYDLEITKIPAKGWYMNKNGIWTAIEHGFRGNFYVRDGKANHKGLVFGATGTVADATFATRAAAAGNQMVEPHTKYNMYVVNEGETHKVFTTIDDNSSKAFTDGTIRVTHTPGNKDAAKTMTLEILAEDNQTTGVDSITAEDAASDADARFFNLQGVEVPADRLAPGIYIRQAGSKATKVLVK